MLTINGKRVYSAINIYAWDENYDDIMKLVEVLKKSEDIFKVVI